ncbi:MAG: Gfo/Idh/MocA family oxidoreductase [Bryobacterales bacterium]|nr:Gfo/Idh/MocA family oxidoreductase [Bryobacterales bacterium]
MHPAALSRRTFLASTAASLARAQQSPNNQLVIGMIGVGNQGTGRLRELLRQPDVRIGGICDVDRSHMDRAAALVEKEKGYKPPLFADFRKLLERKEIDAVSIVTPDHWHAIPTVQAFEAGKDVFVEKPLSYSVAEGRAMADASLRYKRVSQMGNHIHNDLPNYRRVVELVKSGKLGRITRVHAWKTSQTRSFRPNRPDTLPEGFDYDFWLGPAPKRAYNPLRSHGSFRHFWDYSGGSFIDFWCHISDVAFWAMDWKAPQAVTASGGRFFLDDATETPDTLEAILEFPGALYLFSFRPTPLPGFEHMGHIGCLFEGTEASLVTNYEKHEVWSRGKLIPDFPKPAPSIPDSPGHVREFLEAIKTRNLETTCNLRYGHRLSKCGLLANLSFRTGRKLRWDDERERTSEREANAYLGRKFRKPWKL